MRLTLIVGNKNYSSWSLRPWLAMKQAGLAFDEVRVLLNRPDTRAQILRYTPSGRVPCLVDGALAVWDSMAICEYVNEQYAAGSLWPRDVAQRARARSIAAEMHSGFAALRTHLSMDIRGRNPERGAMAMARPDVGADVARIESIWADCLAASSGPFLFGGFSIADAFYAPWSRASAPTRSRCRLAFPPTRMRCSRSPPCRNGWPRRQPNPKRSTTDADLPRRRVRARCAARGDAGLYQGATDVGLGQLTENGADTILFWNDSFFEQFCPMVYPEDACGGGYISLDEEQQIGLRQALVRSVNATCEDCPLGIDLARAEFSVVVFAHTMTANCKQAGQVIRNYTGFEAGKVASYEDLWKFTLVNYNAGGGCLSEGITRALGEGMVLTWDNVSPFFSGACSGAVDYVNDISK